MKRQLVVQVRPDGTVHAETFGMYGDECLDSIALLEDLLDAETVASTFTDDYHRVAPSIEQGGSVTDGERAP